MDGKYGDTGESRIAIQDVLLEPDLRVSSFGVNGTKRRGNALYFTNSSKGIFGRFLINPQGERAGEIEIVARINASATHQYDDFALDRYGDAYIATDADLVNKVSTDGKQMILAEGIKSPTAAAIGRGSEKAEKTVYVTTRGSTVDGKAVGGQVVAISL